MRNTLDVPSNEVRFWSVGDVRVTIAAAVTHPTARWGIEALFTDAQDLPGQGDDQIMMTTDDDDCHRALLDSGAVRLRTPGREARPAATGTAAPRYDWKRAA